MKGRARQVGSRRGMLAAVRMVLASLLLVMLGTAAVSVTAQMAQDLNGQTVSLVSFGQGGQRLGDYRQVGPGQWVETGQDGSTRFQFKEVRRGPWSVFLYDASRKVKIQLDLHKHKVFYSDSGAPQERPIYDVISASVPAPVNIDPQARMAPAAPPPTGQATIPPQPPKQLAPAAGVQASAASAPAQPDNAAQIDASRVVLRCGPVNDASDAAAKCSAICQPYQGFSGHSAIASPPNLAVCQCNALPLAGSKDNEIATQPIQSATDAGKICPAACQWYGGGDGTWRKLGDGTSVCGCAQATR